ncbi:MAG: glycerophosphodiester phosphodiesterase family protein, partial [Armatimonadetes bacterium]|nr:glycerophosphodiester phosphodiesterase family protein [Armatimonadota bacterium]
MRRLCAALACLITIPASLPAGAVRLPAPRRAVAVIAHRGGAGISPENTLAAFRKAAALKADYVELDVRTTRDGKLALMHDSTVDRTTNGKGAVRDLTLAQLRALRVHGPGGAAPQPVPTLDEALAVCKGKVRIYLDQKDADTRRVIAALKAAGMMGGALIYDDPDSLMEWRKLAPTVPVLPSLPSECRKPGGVASFVANRPADGLDGHMLEWTQELVAQAHAAGRPVYADIMGPTDNPQGYAKAIEMGIDGLQTDYPDRLAAYLAERKAQERPVLSVRVGDLNWSVDAAGRTAALRGPGGNIAAGRAPAASVRFGKVETACTSAAARPGRLELRFGETGTVVTLDVAVKPAFATLSVASVTGPQPDRLTFVNIPLTAKGETTDRVCASALALNLKTDVPALPGPSTRLEAACEKRFGLVGARVALMARPYAGLRDALKAAVASSPDLPVSRIGGPWAMDAPEARGSYLFNFGDMTVANVGEWVRTAQMLGVTQI